MATKLEISTVSAVKSIQTLRQQTVALTQVIAGLSKTVGTLQKKLEGSGGAAKATAAKINKTASSIVKMKNVAASAAIQFNALTQKLRLAGAENVRISNLRRSFEALDKKMKAGKLTPIQYANAVNRWKASMSTARRELVRLKDAEQKQTAAAKAAAAATRRLTPVIRRLGTRTRRTEVKVSGLSKRLKILGSSAIFAVGPLSGIGARVAAFGAITSKAGIRIAGFSLGVAGLIIGVIKLAKAMFGVNAEMARIKNSLKAATGDAQSADREFQFLVKTSQDLALDLEAVGLQFSQLSAAAAGTTLAGGGVRDIFTSVSKAALVLGLSAEQTQGAFRALQQMISKGTVPGDELRGQLGERLPGAFQIAARAMGVTTRELGKLMEQGLIRATDLIPKMSAELDKMFDPSIVDAIDSVTASTNLLATAWFLFLDELDRKVQSSKGIQFFMKAMEDALNDMRRGMSGLIEFEQRMKKIDEAIAELSPKLAGLEFASVGRGKFTSDLRAELKRVSSQMARLLEQKRELQKTDTSGPLMNLPLNNPLSNQNFLDLPVTSVNRFQDSLVNLKKVMSVLGDESIDLKKRLDMRDELNRTASALKTVNKIMNTLKDQEVLALQIQLSGDDPLITLKQLRQSILDIVVAEANLQNVVKDAITELNTQSKGANRLKLTFEELNLEVEATQNKLKQAFSGDHVSNQFINSIDEARKMLLKFSEESIAIAALGEGLISKGTFDNFITAEGLARVEAYAKILAVVEQEAGSLIRTMDDAKDMTRIIAETRTETEKFNTEMERLGHLMQVFKDIPEAVEAIKRKMAETDPFLVAISDGIKRMGSDIAGAIRSGANLFDTLKNSFANFLEMLLDLAIQLLIIRPLLASLNLPGGAAAPDLSGTIASLFSSKKGNAFSGGNVVPFVKGGVVSSPSNFSFGSNIGSVAENGPEGILPLKRTASGNLGVETTGAGGVTVNFFLAPGESVRDFNDSQPEIAAMLQGTMASAAASNR